MQDEFAHEYGHIWPMAIYDHFWPPWNRVFTALPEGVKIDRLLGEDNREDQGLLQKNCPITG